MYYKFKIVRYETGEILESSRFYAKRGNAQRYLPAYCYKYVKLHGRYTIEIRSEKGLLLFAVTKMRSDLYEVWKREKWDEHFPCFRVNTFMNPLEEDL